MNLSTFSRSWRSLPLGSDNTVISFNLASALIEYSRSDRTTCNTSFVCQRLWKLMKSAEEWQFRMSVTISAR
jgi:hypothetical protein